jgi:hypothetical protein
MAVFTNSYSDLERRQEKRNQSMVTIKFKTLDGEDVDIPEAIVADVSDSGATLLTHYPLPVGTSLAIEVEGEIVTTAEVVNWQWDYQGDKARLGVKFIDRKKSGPILFLYDQG